MRKQLRIQDFGKEGRSGIGGGGGGGGSWVQTRVVLEATRCMRRVVSSPMGYMYVCNNAYIIQVGSAYKIVVYNT